ncbi:MAG: hypothetical protein VR65_19875 [Desulfobulbaceae bacterium BRH_c16a]|nr:MAG: hypothetical protein VR65_19875 [Desulfobulbaceae bacterium BRH_c16a]
MNDVNETEAVLPVTLRCQVCSELRTMNFVEEDLEDEAFAEIYPLQPWAVPCDECEKLMWSVSDDFDEFIGLHEACLEEERWAIDYARGLIQDS